MQRSNWIRTIAAVVLVAAGAWVMLSHAAKAPASAPDAAAKRDDGWPDTRPGAVGRKWVAAFAAGDSAMTAFYARELSAESLAKKPADQRLGGYHKLRERVGTLGFASVVESAPYELRVKLIDADAESHTFVFTVQSAAPYKLVSVSMMERRSHDFGGFHH